ncbi:MFS transporter [Arcanobacterium haemolyticum]|uniref:Major facilitator superfamily MFS_1 n=1 Tax=Arcanobacterium haemolyticum (strain ATCC 9345 / DSM 20595 / CCM 5947 / CCUG 17215 / LMG 16163 / NBRC 15585 / NCTC 8452 / 11018) TaxID=644284 RepID=D7BM81_ARCHD|nr:major facilitator superfamily MFS_1 [Arcanobacterium haemolyticum DSM 20595]QCX46204.1 MFS transporter [Arcanobacterium haemolyticum]SQH29266.1 Proline porter II [Arcanobacterium haemolyticum]
MQIRQVDCLIVKQSEKPTARQRRVSMLIAASGTIIEWFDFSLFFYLASSLSHTFYPNSRMSMLIVLATGAVGFVFRPLGAIVFGHIGDTRGRTTALITSALLMAISMAGIALMPGYVTIGVWGGIAVLALRALAGFSVGAEYTGIMVYLMETAKPERRGFAASWAAANSEVGALLAVGSAAIVTNMVGAEALHDWGWRIPFAIGAVLAAGMIPLRRFMVESPVAFESKDDRAPLTYTLQEQKLPIAVSFLISTVGSATYFLTITYIPTYIESVHGADSSSALNLGVIAAIAAIVVTPFIGILSDRIGRRWAFGTTLITVVVLAVPGYTLLGSKETATLAFAAVLLAIPAAAWSAIAAAAIPEQFAARGRFSGMALGYNVATVLFGGLTPFVVSWLSDYFADPLAPAYYASIVTIIAGTPTVILLVDRVRDRQRSRSRAS